MDLVRGTAEIEVKIQGEETKKNRRENPKIRRIGLIPEYTKKQRKRKRKERGRRE